MADTGTFVDGGMRGSSIKIGPDFEISAQDYDYVWIFAAAHDQQPFEHDRGVSPAKSVLEAQGKMKAVLRGNFKLFTARSSFPGSSFSENTAFSSPPTLPLPRAGVWLESMLQHCGIVLEGVVAWAVKWAVSFLEVRTLDTVKNEVGPASGGYR